MRIRTMLWIGVLGWGTAGCRSSHDLRPPTPPAPIADAAAGGDRKVLLNQMHEMAVEDASSLRR